MNPTQHQRKLAFTYINSLQNPFPIEQAKEAMCKCRPAIQREDVRPFWFYNSNHICIYADHVIIYMYTHAYLYFTPGHISCDNVTKGIGF